MTAWYPLAVAVLGAAAAGFVAERVAIAALHAAGRRRHSRFAEAAARSLAGMPTLLGALAGAWWAVLDARLAPETEALALKALGASAILIATMLAARVAGWAARLYTAREDTRLPSSTIFVNLARGTAWIVGVLSLLGALGISIAPMVAALGVGGLAVGLALQPTLENVFSGIQVLLSGQIAPGDYIKLQTGEQGWVDDVAWRNTTLKLLSGDLVIVPNAVIAKSLMTRYVSADERVTVTCEFAVATASDLAAVERAAAEAARAVQRGTEGADAEHEPGVRLAGFGERGVNVRVTLRALAPGGREAVLHAFTRELHARFAAEGIEFGAPPAVSRG